MAEGTAEPFSVGIEVSMSDRGKIVTDRIASRDLTRYVQERPDISGAKKKGAFRRNMIQILKNACEDEHTAAVLQNRIIKVAETMSQNKAISFRVEDDSYKEHGVPSLKAVDGELFEGYRSLAQHSELINSGLVLDTIFHPLIIASLAFCLGGPINAANTAFAHRWRRPPQIVSETEVRNFHTEGDDGDIFNTHCVTLVWETCQGKPSGPSGDHHVFFSDDAEPRQLVCGNANPDKSSQMPMIIVFDAKNASLVYDCQSSQAVRNSITLSFHLHTMDNDVINMLYPSEHVQEIEQVSLAKLITSSPINDYTSYFHRLLFSPESVQAILKRLSTLDVPLPPKSPINPETKLNQRAREYGIEHIMHVVPRSILAYEQDIRISGIHKKTSDFFADIILKARRDIYLPLGADLFPYNQIDSSRELVRRFFCSQPRKTIEKRLAVYAEGLLDTPFTSGDLPTTTHLAGLARFIEIHCLKLVSAGYIDANSILPAMSFFVAALGRAIGGSKESDRLVEPWVDGIDLQIFRTRCLHLLLCIDWLVDYLGKPIEGQFMVMKPKESELSDLKRLSAHLAKSLFRNWVAWGVFMESLPTDGFWVRLPVPHAV